MEKKPYVVSADIELLVRKWASSAGLTAPAPAFFEMLRSQLSNYLSGIFLDVEIVSENDIFSFLKEETAARGLETLSLDAVYHTGNYVLELTRTIDSANKDKGLRTRHGFPSLKEQLNLILSSGIKEACLVDDVIFSGELMERIVRLLSRLGIKVPVAYAGIGIGKGVDRLRKIGCAVSCFRTYSCVTDEICERDFYVGIPFSGRSSLGTQDISIPYMLPYGNPCEWASIPDSRQKEFSEFCIRQSITLFEEIELRSSRVICSSEVSRKIYDQPEKGRYVDFLKTISI